MRKRRPAGSAKNPTPKKCNQSTGYSTKFPSGSAFNTACISDYGEQQQHLDHAGAISVQQGSDHFVHETPKLRQNEGDQLNRGQMAETITRSRRQKTKRGKATDREAQQQQPLGLASACPRGPVTVKPRKLGLNKSVQSPLSFVGGGAVKRKRKACPIILDDSSEDDVVEIKETLPPRSSPNSKPKVKLPLTSPEVRSKVPDRKRIGAKYTPSPRSNGSSDGISPKPNPPINTPLRTLLLDDILSSQADSQVDVKWDFRSPNAIKDARMYNMGSDQDGNDLIAMLKHVETQESPEHFGTPPPAPIFSMLCLPKENKSTEMPEKKEPPVRMTRRSSRKKECSKNTQSLEFLKKLAEYIEEQTDVDKGHDEVDLKEEEKRSPKLLPEEDLNSAIHEDDSFADEEDLFGNDDAVTSKISSQLQPSPVLNPVVLSTPSHASSALKSSPRRCMDIGLLLKDTSIEHIPDVVVAEKPDVKAKTSVDEFVGDDTLDDLFGDDSFMEKATQMTNELFDEKTRKFKTPKGFGKVITTNAVSKDNVKPGPSSSISATVSITPVTVPQIRQNLFAKPCISKSASVPAVKTTNVCATCVANRLPSTTTSSLSFPSCGTRTNNTYDKPFPMPGTGQFTGLTKPTTQNQWTKSTASSNVKPVGLVSSVRPVGPGSVVHGPNIRSSTDMPLTKKTVGPNGQNVVFTKPLSVHPQAKSFSSTGMSVSVSTACGQNKAATGTTSTGAKFSTKSVTNITNTSSVKWTPPSQTMTIASKSSEQSVSNVSCGAAVKIKTVSPTSNATDSAYFCDLSLSEDLLFQLAEPDDILDSQVTNSGSSSGSVDHNNAGSVELSMPKGVSKTQTVVQNSNHSSSNSNSGSKIATSSIVSSGKSRCSLTSGCKTTAANSSSCSISPAPAQPGVSFRMSQITNQTNSREVSTMILDDSDLTIPPTQMQRKPKNGPQAPKFNFKATGLHSGVNVVTRSQVKASPLPSSSKPSENVPKNSGSSEKGSQDKKPVDFGLDTDDDDDQLFESQVLAMLENVENQASQTSSQPSSQNQCSAEEIEKKKQEALKRRIEKKRQEAIKRREAQLHASQKAHLARNSNVGGLSGVRKTRKS